MGNMFGNHVGQPLTTQRQTLESKYAKSRHNLLLVVAFTAINILLLVLNSNTYFLFSAYIPYILVDTGRFFTGMYSQEYYAEQYINTEFLGTWFYIATLIIATAILALYLISWFGSKNGKVGWSVFALVLFSVDTVALLLLGGITVENMIDILFHAWVIFSLISGISAHKKLSSLPCEADTEQTAPITADNTCAVNSQIIRPAQTNTKAKILLEAEAMGHKITYRRVKRVNELIVDGNVYDEMEALIEFAHCLHANIDGHRIDAGFDGASHSYINIDGQQVARKFRI